MFGVGFLVSGGFREEDYLFSSARNYADLDHLIEIIMETSQLITY